MKKSILFCLFSWKLVIAQTFSQMKIDSIAQVFMPVLYLDSREYIPIIPIEYLFQSGVSWQIKHKPKSFVRSLAIHSLDSINAVVKTQNIQPKKHFLAWKDPNKNKNKNPSLYTYPQTPTLYYRWKESENAICIQYWYFLPYNDVFLISKKLRFIGNHQGDWEHISVILDKQKLQSQPIDKQTIAKLFFARHADNPQDSSKFKPIQDSTLSWEGNRIKVYIACGSHASYPHLSPPKGFLLQNILGYKLYDYADGKGLKVEHYTLTSATHQFWYSYAGRWGKIKSGFLSNIIEWLTDASNDGPISIRDRGFEF